MNTDFDPAHINWDSPDVKYLFEHLQAKSKQQEDRIIQLEADLKHRDENITQLKTDLKHRDENITQLKAVIKKTGG